MIYDTAKRIIDILASLVLIVLFLPVWIIVPLLIKLESKGPIFYLPTRIGMKGKPFKMFKFRSMKMFEVDGKTVHAVEFWKQNPELYEKYKQSGWKLTLEEDPRVTKLGKILRQTSIDEFPQVFNILLGTMSLVGPRAYVSEEIDDARKRYKDIGKHINASLSAKPGLTGVWQVSGRNDIPWDERVKMDAAYAKRRNLLEDFKIIFKTPLAMISKW
jgi:lipopolysaccharide/colanic/teichoic acid biosynthesis glycosyltransferase